MPGDSARNSQMSEFQTVPAGRVSRMRRRWYFVSLRRTRRGSGSATRIYATIPSVVVMDCRSREVSCENALISCVLMEELTVPLGHRTHHVIKLNLCLSDAPAERIYLLKIRSL